MRAAILARKSTADVAESLSTQVANARAYAELHGMVVIEPYVWTFEDVSASRKSSGEVGAKFTAMINRIMAAAERKAFDVLIVRDLDRLTRDDLDQSPKILVFKLKQAGVDVHEYVTGQRVDVGSIMSRFLLDAKGLAKALEAQATSERTREALARRAAAGHAIQQPCYGYRNEPVFEGGRRVHVKRVIEPAQAAVVKRVFEMTGGGAGPLTIADTLNAEHVPAPKPRGLKVPRPPMWTAPGIRDMLHRPIYRGQVTDDLHREDLRIVPESLWAAVQALRDARTAKSTNLANRGPVMHRQSSYLLSGFAVCGGCRSPLIVWRRKRKPRPIVVVPIGNNARETRDNMRAAKKRNPIAFVVAGNTEPGPGITRETVVYRCMRYHTSGRHSCPHPIAALPVNAADRAVWNLIRDEVAPESLRQEVVDRYIAQAMAEAAKPDSTTADVTREEAKLARYDEAIGDPDAGDVAGLIKARKQVLTRIAELKAQQEGRKQMEPEQLAQAIEDFKGAIKEYLDAVLGPYYPDPEACRPLLAGFLDGPITFEPSKKEEKTVRFTMRAGADRVLEGIAARTMPATRRARSSRRA